MNNAIISKEVITALQLASSNKIALFRHVGHLADFKKNNHSRVKPTIVTGN